MKKINEKHYMGVRKGSDKKNEEQKNEKNRKLKMKK